MLNSLSVRNRLLALVLQITATGLLLSVLVSRLLAPLNEGFEAYADQTRHRAGFVEVIQGEFGYAGAIHAFKNYVLRGNPKYVARFEEAFVKVNQSPDGYLAVNKAMLPRDSMRSARRWLEPLWM